LPGIGPTIAAAIVAHRERDGPFRSVDELVEVRGIGDARLADLRDLVVVR
jgi:competence protein ComEA